MVTSNVHGSWSFKFDFLVEVIPGFEEAGAACIGRRLSQVTAVH